MHLTNFVVHAGVKKNPLGSGCFTSVNVGGNTDVAVALNRGMASHGGSFVDLYLEDAARTTRRRRQPLTLAHCDDSVVTLRAPRRSPKAAKARS